uniref:Uncharacterized protein TCIL3000_11_10860 n=1 Tax=Trypanosoma congolense (strain IL3000) TaxID=1068625 RepID=G0V1T8_TRYCI|nr:unnamed protein product [Trypanosoma congolense IL3000]
MPGCGLTEQVEAIAWESSALPTALAPHQILDIFSALEKNSTELSKGKGFLFGVDSIASRSSSFLVSNGCPPSARITSSFAAAAAHSELGRMMSWFAGSVVSLFVNGVKSGVGFPQQWEEYLHQCPGLKEFRFELQGFSTLFAFLLCQLAAVESSLSVSGVSGDVSPSLETGLPGLQAGAQNLAVSDVEDGTLRSAVPNFPRCPVVPSLKPQSIIHKKRNKFNTVESSDISSNPLLSRMAELQRAANKPGGRRLSLPPPSVPGEEGASGNLLSQFSNGSMASATLRQQILPQTSFRCTEQLSTQNHDENLTDRPHTNHRETNPTLPAEDPSHISSSRATLQSSGARHASVSCINLSLTPQPIASVTSILCSSANGKYSRLTGTRRTDGEGSGTGEQNRSEHTVRGRVDHTNGYSRAELNSLPRVKEYEEKMRANELAKLYGVRNITNYSQRDEDDFKAHMNALRELLDE